MLKHVSRHSYDIDVFLHVMFDMGAKMSAKGYNVNTVISNVQWIHVTREVCPKSLGKSNISRNLYSESI